MRVTGGSKQMVTDLLCDDVLVEIASQPTRALVHQELLALLILKGGNLIVGVFLARNEHIVAKDPEVISRC